MLYQSITVLCFDTIQILQHIFNYILMIECIAENYLFENTYLNNLFQNIPLITLKV